MRAAVNRLSVRRFSTSSEVYGLAPAKPEAFNGPDRPAQSRREGDGVMNEEEYDRWLAESLDEALRLLRQKGVEASRQHAFATQRPGADAPYPDVSWLEPMTARNRRAVRRIYP